jgi:hypothetical protein
VSWPGISAFRHGATARLIVRAKAMALRPSAVGPGPVLAGCPTCMAARPGAPRRAKGSHEPEKRHDAQGEQRRRDLPPGDHHRFTPHGTRPSPGLSAPDTSVTGPLIDGPCAVQASPALTGLYPHDAQRPDFSRYPAERPILGRHRMCSADAYCALSHAKTHTWVRMPRR